MFEHDDCINDLPTDEMLTNWREANEYVNDEAESEPVYEFISDHFYGIEAETEAANWRSQGYGAEVRKVQTGSQNLFEVWRTTEEA